MQTNILFIFLCIVAVASQECNDTCYNGIDQKLKHLNDIYNNPPNVSKLPSNVKDIKNLIKEFEQITENKRNITTISEKINNNNETILNQKNEIKKIEDVIQFLKELEKDFSDMDSKTKFHNDTLDTCEKSNEQFMKLKKDIEEIEKLGQRLNDSYYKNLDTIDRINEESSRIKKELDDIVLPDLTTKYICNSNLTTKIKEILKIGSRLRKILEYIKEHMLDNLKKKIQDNNKMIDDIATFNKSAPELPLKSTDETKPLIKSVKDQLDDLKEKLKNLKITGNDLSKVKDVTEEALKEFETILTLLFSKDNRKRVQKEIKTAKDILKVIKERNNMKNNLRELEKIVKQLLRGAVCTVQEDIDFEPNLESSI